MVSKSNTESQTEIFKNWKQFFREVPSMNSTPKINIPEIHFVDVELRDLRPHPRYAFHKDLLAVSDMVMNDP